jgi:hypothetical protein
VDEATLLKAYEGFNEACRSGRLRLVSLVMMTVDRERGALAITLDANKPEASREAQAIDAWSAEVTPVGVLVKLDPNPGMFVPLNH